MGVRVSESVTIERPAAAVIAVLRDIDGQSAWWPGQYLSTALEHDDQGRVTRSRIGNDVKIAKDEFEVAYTHDRGDEGYTWVLDSASLVQRSQSGQWSVRELGDARCEASLELSVDTTLPLPGFVARKAIGDTVKGAVQGLKEFCEARAD